MGEQTFDLCLDKLTEAVVYLAKGSENDPYFDETKPGQIVVLRRLRRIPANRSANHRSNLSALSPRSVPRGLDHPQKRHGWRR